MTREEVVATLNRFALAHSCSVECMDELQQIRDHDAKQREEIAQLQHAYQQLADAHEAQHQEVMRLRKQLESLAILFLSDQKTVMTPLKKGWLKRQTEIARKDIAKWPKWMRREAGLKVKR